MPEFASIARIAFSEAAHNPVDLRVGRYKDLLPDALEDMVRLDLVFFNTLYEQQNNYWLFEACLKQCAWRYDFCFRRHQKQPQDA